MSNHTYHSSINVRTANTYDIDNVVSFNCDMAFETEGIMLDQKKLVLGVSAVLLDPDLGFYLVAEVENDVIGQLMITKEWSDWRNSMFWWIQSVFVKPEYRRIGVYTALHVKVLDMAKEETNVCGVRLYVDRENTVAKQTYSQLGMSHSNYDMFEIAL
ncbi:MAG: GNAT family N-acetyltransferase [Chloroflexota bacterium]|nr:GNAT family N-acetyltransferase [Chloroflexota bacterium]